MINEDENVTELDENLLEEENDPLWELIFSYDFHHFPETTCTVCCLVLLNNFTIIGESSCINPEDFDEDVGQELAFQDAFNQLAKYEAYMSKEVLYQEALEANTPE